MRWEFTITIITIFLQSYFFPAPLLYGYGYWRPFEAFDESAVGEKLWCMWRQKKKRKINILLVPSLGSGGGGRGIMMTWSYLIEFYYFLLFHGKFLCALGRFHVERCESVELPPIECGASDDLSAWWWLKAWDRSRLFSRSLFYCYKYYENYY